MAYPAAMHMHQHGVLCAVATADTDAEIPIIYEQLATTWNIPYHKISKKNCNEQIRNWLNELKPDALFVMTFPWRLPADILAIPSRGCFNFHYGLLPEMRGADPIFESIRTRKPDVGLTVHIMDEGLDTGPIVARQAFPLKAELTYGMVCQQMAFEGEKVCATLIDSLKSTTPITGAIQDEQVAKYWPKLIAAQITIRWDEMEVADVKAIVKACNPIAKGAPVALNGWKMGICEVTDVNLEGDASAYVPGTILAIDIQNGLIVCCKDGKALKIDVLYTEQGFFPGHKLAMWGINAGMKFTSV